MSQITRAGDDIGPIHRTRTIATKREDLNFGRGGTLEAIVKASADGLVFNPFKKWNNRVARKLATEFALEYDLGDKKDIFVTAAALLRDSWIPGDARRFNRDDLDALARDRAGFWQQPKTLRLAVSLLALSAVVQGWTQSVSNVSNLGWPSELGLGTMGRCHPDATDVWHFSLVNASTYLAACSFGCWLSDPLSELFWGRRPPVLTSAVLIIAASIGAALVPNASESRPDTWKLLLACRILIGLGMGCKATVINVFVAEVSPPHLRGRLVVNWQLFTALGIFLGFAFNLAIAHVDHAWRWQTVSLCIPTVFVLALVYTCPDSPRYQMKRSSELQRRRRSGTSPTPTVLATWLSGVLGACLQGWLGVYRACLGRTGSKVKDGCVADPDLEAPEQDRSDGQDSEANQEDETDRTSDGDRDRSMDHGLNQNGGQVHERTQQRDQDQTPSPDDRQSYDRERQHARDENHDYRQAFETLKQLRNSELLAAKELLYTHIQMVIETRMTLESRIWKPPTDPNAQDRLTGDDELSRWLNSPTKGTLWFFEKVLHLWTIKRIRRATGNALICMSSQQLSGVNVLAFYSATLFSSCSGSARLSDTLLPLGLSCGIGAVNFLCGLPAYKFIERPGRRASLLRTIPLLAICMLGTSISFWVSDSDTTTAPGSSRNLKASATCTFFFMAAYSVGMGPVPFTMSSEVFPLEHRMVGMSFAVFANLFGAGILALIVPPIINSNFRAAGLLGIFTGFNVMIFFLVLLYLRETAGTANKGTPMSLEELNFIFNKSTTDFIKMEWKHRRWIRKKIIFYPFRWLWKRSGFGDGQEVVERPRRQTFTEVAEGDIEMQRGAATSSQQERAPTVNGHI